MIFDVVSLTLLPLICMTMSSVPKLNIGPLDSKMVSILFVNFLPRKPAEFPTISEAVLYF